MATTAVDPVSTPPRGVVYLVALAMLVCAGGGVFLGYKASLRENAGRSAPTGLDDAQGVDQAVVAKPIVDIPAQAVPVPEASNALAAATNTTSKSTDNSDASSNDLAVRTAAVQHVQSTPAQSSQDIDTILASPTERPQTPAKPSTDDEPPPPPKTDVPF
jgi:hypothetical protein